MKEYKINLNQRYKKIIGVDVKALLKSTQNIHKMAWEQVLLLAIFTRQQYFLADGQSFKNRMALVHEARQYNDLCGDVLMRLDQGKGSNDIVSMLLQHKSLSKNALLRAIEEKAIAFKPGNHACPYSHYAMYMILRHPLMVFRALLALDTVSVPDYIVNTLQRLHAGPFRLFQKDNALYADGLTLDGMLDLIEEKNLKVNGKNLTLEVKSRMVNDIGRCVKEAFHLLTLRPNDQQLIEEPTTLFNEMCKAERSREGLSLIFDRAKLDNLVNLGQIEGVLAEVKAALLNTVDGSTVRASHSRSGDLNNAGALDMLSEWYRRTNTGLIKKIDRVPQLIALILDFDVRYGIGVGEMLPMQNFRSRLMSRDYNQLVSGIIRHALFRANELSALTSPALYAYNNVSEFLEKVEEGADKTLPVFALMKVWADPEQGAMTERFKKLPPYLKVKKEREYVSGKIEQQRRQSRECSYPINALFPLPLWAAVD